MTFQVFIYATFNLVHLRNRLLEFGSERLETVVNFFYEKHFRYSKVPDSGISSSIDSRVESPSILLSMVALVPVYYIQPE